MFGESDLSNPRGTSIVAQHLPKCDQKTIVNPTELLAIAHLEGRGPARQEATIARGGVHGPHVAKRFQTITQFDAENHLRLSPARFHVGHRSGIDLFDDVEPPVEEFPCIQAKRHRKGRVVRNGRQVGRRERLGDQRREHTLRLPLNPQPCAAHEAGLIQTGDRAVGGNVGQAKCFDDTQCFRSPQGRQPIDQFVEIEIGNSGSAVHGQPVTQLD